MAAAKGRKLTALRILDPAKWRERVRTTVAKHDQRLGPAAKALGMSRRTLQRWANELRLRRAPTGVHLAVSREGAGLRLILR